MLIIHLPIYLSLVLPPDFTLQPSRLKELNKASSDLLYNLPEVYLHCTRIDLTVWLLLSLLSLYHDDNFLKIRCRTHSAWTYPENV